MKRTSKRVGWLAVASLALACGVVAARGVSPYLPLGLDPQVEWQIERVLILADKPVMRRPIAVATVYDALPKAARIDPALCERVRRFIENYMHDSGVAFASYEAAAAGGPGGKMVMPNSHGAPVNSNYGVAVQGYVQPSDYLLLSAGVVADANRTTPTGSMLSMGWDWAQLDVGYRDHWWSPMSDSAALISTEAPTMPSVTLSNYRPLTSLGLQYEVFLARMSYTNQIQLIDGSLTAGYPKFGGVQLSVEPISGWSLAAQRIMVWGGGEAGGQSANTILNAFFNPAGAQNTSSSKTQADAIGKQEGGISSQFIFPGKLPFTVYFEYTGNDTVDGNNFLLGKPNLAGGIHFPHVGPLDIVFETQEWQATWYVHEHTNVQTGYGDGITNYYLSTGNWFGDQRVNGDAIGGRSSMLRAGWEPSFGGQLALQYRVLANDSYYGAIPYHHMNMGSLTYAYPWRGFAVGAEFDLGQDVFGGHFTRFEGFLRYGEALRAASSTADAFDSEREEGTELFVEAGGTANNVKLNVTAPTCCTTTGTTVGAHAGVGAWRQATEHQDLGVEVEGDDIRGLSLFSIRLLDWRYRFNGPVAFNAFLGASRYALATPAIGVYLGAGLQWRDIVPKWDLGLEYRYADKVSRLRVLPSDPQGGFRPDSFYDITMLTLSLTRKF
jgi:capsule assembly protein Wzi